jgi:prepilin-type N-terminal cleavage/methylation domain-containing protein
VTSAVRPNTRAPARTAGFTLVELMAVVAIVGILSAIGLSGVMHIAKLGKVNGTATALARMMTNARTRAILERCMYVVQVTGPQWAPGAAAGPDVRKIPKSIQVYRKATCNSTNGFFETGQGDKLISEFDLDDSNGNVLMLTGPGGVVPGDIMGANAVSFAWAPDGTRLLYVDATGTTAWVQNSVLAGAFTFNLIPSDANIPPLASDVQRAVSIPKAGPASAP